MRSSTFSFLLLLLLAACGLFTACHDDVSKPQNTAETAAAKPALSFKTLTKDGCEVHYLPPPTTTPMNDPFIIAIEALADAQASIDINTENCNKDFEAELKNEPPETDGDKAFLQRFSLSLEPQWHGTVTVPEILVSFSFKDRSPVVIPLPAATITVTEQSADSQAPLDDSAAQTLRDGLPPKTPIPWIAILSSVAILAVIVAIWYFAKRPPKAERVRAVPVQPPHKIALRELDDLLAQQLIEKGFYKQFYDRISEILRDYIERRFNLKAPERTTEEFLQELRVSQDIFSKQHLLLLNNVMKHTDLVKYARLTPSSDEITQTIRDTRTFITETIPSTTAASAAPATNTKA